LVCCLIGAFLIPVASGRTRAAVLLLMLLLLIGGGWYFIGEKFQTASVAASPTASAGDWERFTPERLASELQQRHPVFIDFTAEWCITCKFNESTVLETAAVRAAFSEHQIVKLKADWTNGDPAITKLLKQFGRPGDYKIIKTIRPARCPIVCTLSGRNGPTVCFPGIAHEKYRAGKIGNR